MKRISIYFLFLFSVIILNSSCKKTSSPPENNNVNLKKGLLLYFPFSGSIADSSGNNNSVQVSGVNLTNDQHLNPNSAFDASQGRLLVTNNGSIKFDSAFSLSLNFKLNASGVQCYLSMVNNTNGFGPSFSLGSTVPKYDNFGFAVQDGTGNCNFFGDPSNSNNDTTQFIPQKGTWYNMVCIYHKGSIQVYKNGKLISTQSSSGTSALLCPSSKFIIGGWWDTDSEIMNGVIDEVRLYNRILNADEIAQLYKNFQ